MNDTHATKYLLSLPAHLANGTAERTRRLLLALPEGQKPIEVIKIFGEAGKSTAAALLSSLLTHSGIKNGCVFLKKQAEPRTSLRIDGQAVSHAAFADAVTKAWQAARACGTEDPSYEEILLVCAFYLFAREGCSTASVVMDADKSPSAASALSSPTLCVVTSLSKQTAERALGLIDARSEMVSPPQPLEVYNLLRGHAAARFNIPMGQDLRDISVSGHTLSFTLYGDSYTLPTPALYHVNNAALVIEAYRALVRQKKNVTKKALDLSLADSRLYVGFRLYSLSPAWLLDAADTPYRIGALLEAVDALPHMFGDGFDMLVQEGLETLCTDTFGDRIHSLSAVDEKAVAKTVKALSLPCESALVVLGSKSFLSHVKRALDARFLFG